jgi:hypothetical protein
MFLTLSICREDYGGGAAVMMKTIMAKCVGRVNHLTF